MKTFEEIITAARCCIFNESCQNCLYHVFDNCKDRLRQDMDKLLDGQDSIPAYTTSLDDDWWDRPLTMSNDQWRY